MSHIPSPAIATYPIIFIGRKSRALSHSLQSDLASSSSFITESFLGARLIKSYQLEKEQKHKAIKYFNRLKILYVKLKHKLKIMSCQLLRQKC